MCEHVQHHEHHRLIDDCAFATDSELKANRALLTALCKALVKAGLVSPIAITKELQAIASKEEPTSLLRDDIDSMYEEVLTWPRP
jgi:hypothetical protein